MKSKILLSIIMVTGDGSMRDRTPIFRSLAVIEERIAYSAVLSEG